MKHLREHWPLAPKPKGVIVSNARDASRSARSMRLRICLDSARSGALMLIARSRRRPGHRPAAGRCG
jgi:hypothetical protein